jgi:hypothetical protein
MTEITAPLPAGTIAATVRDAEWRGAQVGLPRPLLSYTDEPVTTLTWRYPDGTALDPELVEAWETAVADPTVPEDAPWHRFDPETIGEAVAWLAALVALPSTATTVEGLRTDVNNKSAAISGALEQIVLLLGGQ